MRKQLKYCILFCIISMAIFAAGCGKKDAEKEKKNTGVTTEAISTEEIIYPDEVATAQDATFTDEEGFTVRNDFVKVTADTVNVRTAPDADAAIFRIMQKDEILSRTGDNAVWTRVSIDNTSFYIYSEYLEVTAETSKPEPTTEDTGENTGDNAGEQDNPHVTTKKKILAIDAGNQGTADFDVEPIGPESETTKQRATKGNVGIALQIKEYEINLTYAQLLKEELEKRGYTIIMTRNSNVDSISNAERAEIANNSEATAVIRIQMNYSSDINMTGAMAVCMTEDSQYNKALYSESYKLSTRILQGITQDESIVNRGIYKTNQLTFVNWSKIPVSVIKLGYLSNIEEEANLNNPEYQKKLVNGIADGIDYYFNY